MEFSGCFFAYISFQVSNSNSDVLLFMFCIKIHDKKNHDQLYNIKALI